MLQFESILLIAELIAVIVVTFVMVIAAHITTGTTITNDAVNIVRRAIVSVLAC